MKKIQRRDKMKIYGDLLALLSGDNKNQKIVLTRLQVQVNVPFDRLQTYISDLKELGLIEEELRPTEKGKQYLREYEKVLEFMKRMGLTYR